MPAQRMKSALLRMIAVTLVIAAVPASAAQPAPQMTPAQMIAAQRSAMAKLSSLDGVWRGSGWMIDQPGETPRQMTMTYRVGPALDRTIRIIEIRGYLADGSFGFHAFNTISFDAQKNAYVMNARAAGRSGAFDFELATEGYVWRIGGADAGLHYAGSIKDQVWKESGRAIAPGRDPVAMSEFTLRRVGDTDWPDAGAIGPK
ncbi:hypothetical protein HNQ60_005420 [Povalibacter uvarum]|uniref:DUF1579 domain-containing protein n=1 Tax=Povalibacter uvarum TaxID=732238 RepID=A0A841HX60_9GAMM|nr:DUF1579 domain-containing protein [Povalibacter uvarum]MBB6096498.1 hypothetical protein [Povalibacter uvarum]